MKYLKQLFTGIEVAPILAELDAHPEVWDVRRLRKATYVHGDVSDVWIRFNAWENYDPEGGEAALKKFVLEPHDAVWYPESDCLPSLKTLIFELMCTLRAERLGTVLITKIPPGKQVHPHIDPGWAARFYEKVAVQLRSAPEQSFCFDDGRYVCEAGTIYSFDNSQTHWVDNDSAVDRITAIICIKRDVRAKMLAHD